MEQEIPWEEQKKRIEQLLQGKLKRLSKAKKHWEKELQHNALWEETQHEAELLKANYAHFHEKTAQLEVWDWKREKLCCLECPKDHSWKEWMASLFKRARKQRSSLIPIQKHLNRLQEEETKFLQQLQTVMESTSSETLTPWLSLLVRAPKAPVATTKAIKKEPWFTFWTAKGEVIWVGRNASGNEKLTFTQAHGKDIWLHTVGESGSHVVLRPRPGIPLDDHSLKDAMQLALYYSKGRDKGEGEVLWTERKEVHRPKKKAALGRVEVRTFRSKQIRLDKELIRSIQGRHNFRL